MAFSPETYAKIHGQVGQKYGFAPLNGNKKVPAANLPSYVDDVVEGYYYNGAFYSDAQHTDELDAETGKIYIDVPTGWSYRWSGSEYVLIGTGAVSKGTITLSTTWSGSGPYTQTVTVTGAVVTVNSLVELLPTAAQLAQLISDGVQAIVIENNAGVLTATALGAATSAAMTVQCSVTEVAS